jgi:hypothetical protein
MPIFVLSRLIVVCVHCFGNNETRISQILSEQFGQLDLLVVKHRVDWLIRDADKTFL